MAFSSSLQLNGPYRVRTCATPATRSLAAARGAFKCRCSSDQQQQNARLREQQQHLQHLQHAPVSGMPAGSLSETDTYQASRRSMIAAAAVLAGLASLPEPLPARAADDLTITDRIYLDVGIASSAFKPAGERTLGDKTVLPKDAEPAGRIVIGLYGKLAPVTVSNILSAIKAGSFTGSAFSRISPGEYIQAGKQGSRRLGDVDPPSGLAANTDLAAPGPFKLTHSRPGTVSLSLSESDEDPGLRERTDYRGLEFLITTGPGPVPRLDGLNPVFGRVESGMDTVIRLSQVPSFQPDIRSQQLNRFAKFLGDERADNVRRQYGRPLKAIVILDSGVLPADAADAALQREGALALSAGSMVELP